ncbi:MAG: hypothetical protein HYS32_02055 [Candidatus Woesearchaeota archaeon]|nr:MAG: hypothetical protein HYS32_02055 [Candidatus Woesearchaeota archaeon]
MEEIKFLEWEKFDFRIGEISEVNDHPNAERLYILKVGLGDKEIQLVAGIKIKYKKEELIGRKIVVFANLEPAKLRGIESNGMLLAADVNGEPFLLTTDKTVPNGAKVK